MTDEKIQSRLQSDYDFLKSEGWEVLGVFLFGSQNYKTDRDKSDIDVRGIVINKPKEFTMGFFGGGRTYHRPNGCLYITTVQELYYSLSGSSLVYAEPFTSRWFIVNPNYEWWVCQMKQLLNKLVDMNPVGVCNYYRDAINHKLDITFNSPDRPEVQSYGFWSKPLATALTWLDEFKQWVEGSIYTETIVPRNHVYLCKLKQDPAMLSLEEAKTIAKQCSEELSSLVTTVSNGKNLLSLVELKKLDIMKEFEQLTVDAVLHYVKTEC